MASTAVKPLAGLQVLELGANATFTAAAGVTACFNAGTTIVKAAPSSTLALPAGFAQQVKAILVDGVPLAAGTYTGTGGATGTVLSLIDGTGTIEVTGDPGMTIWSGATDSDWNTAGNWEGGLPAIDKTAYVFKKGTFSIDVDSAVQNAGSLTVDKSEGLATIAVGAELSVPDGAVDIPEHAKLAVSEYGELNVTGHVDIRDCGELAVEGGRVTVSPPDSTEDSPYLSVDNALVSFTNAELTVTGNGGMFPSGAALFLGGGTESSFSGSTVVKVEEAGWGSIVFGTGNHAISGSAQVLGNTGKTTRNAFTAEGPGETCTITLTNSAKLDLFKCVDVGRAHPGSLTEMRFRDDSVWYVAGSLNIGTHNGCGVVDIAGSAKVYGGGEDGTHLGYRSACRSWGEDSGAFPTGIVRVAGWGCLYARGGKGGANPGGLVIGDGCCLQNPMGAITSRYNGIVEISENGFACSDNGPLVIGAGHGYGLLSISGGSARTKYTGTPAVIGLGGAEGELRLTGGSCSFSGDLAVGGASSTTHSEIAGWSNVPLSRCCAKGLVNVSAGTVTVTGKLSVGEAGDGELRLAGAGRINAASLELVDVYDSAASEQRHSTLRFAVGANGQAGTLAVAGAATVGTGSRVVVDFSGYTASQALDQTVATWTGLTGTISDITVTGTNGRAHSVDITSTGIRIQLAKIARPMTLMVK